MKRVPLSILDEPAARPRPAAARRPCGLKAAALLLALASAGCASGFRPPQFAGGTDLVYPEAALAAGVEGRVLVRYDVTEEGRVVNVTVEVAEPPGVFEAAALAAVRSWRFKPAAEAGRVVAARNRVSAVTFQLGDDGKYDHLPVPRGGR